MADEWLTLTVDDLYRVVGKRECDAIVAAAEAEGQDDPLPGSILMGVRKVRGSLKRYIRGAGDTVPPELELEALHIAAFLAANAVRAPENRARTSLYEDAIATLKLAQAGDLTISVPNTPEATPPQKPAQTPTIANSREREFTRAQQDGI